MCGRFEIVGADRVFVRFQVRGNRSPLTDQLDVRPTTQIAAIVQDHQLQLMSWWLVPSWSKSGQGDSRYPTFNARAEGIEAKASFRGPLRRSRCLIPASAFFEWQHGPGHKQKIRIARKDADMFAFAGLYDSWTDRATGEERTSCAIITCQPNALMAPIHTRMPVMLLPEDEAEWLSPDLHEPEHILQFLKPYPEELLVASAA